LPDRSTGREADLTCFYEEAIMNLKVAFYAGLIIIAGIFYAQPALGAKPPGGHLNIVEVMLDFDNEVITIIGEDFDFGDPLVVTLGGVDISNHCNAWFDPLPHLINCNFMPTSGDYLLTVSTGNGQSQGDEYDLTIGAVGPQGPQGEPGQPGGPGPQGPPGVPPTALEDTQLAVCALWTEAALPEMPGFCPAETSLCPCWEGATIQEWVDLIQASIDPADLHCSQPGDSAVAADGTDYNPQIQARNNHVPFCIVEGFAPDFPDQNNWTLSPEDATYCKEDIIEICAILQGG
jgi:hypothetical protein